MPLNLNEKISTNKSLDKWKYRGIDRKSFEGYGTVKFPINAESKWQIIESEWTGVSWKNKTIS
jgi:hypothetical protein